ncbi:MAG: DUF4258 domain-containing protein, partial [Nitrososphaerales archaeon]
FISEAQIENTLIAPLQMRPTKYGREVACKHFPQCYYIVVIFERVKEGFIVVTTVRVDRERVIRYGFTGI